MFIPLVLVLLIVCGLLTAVAMGGPEREVRAREEKRRAYYERIEQAKQYAAYVAHEAETRRRAQCWNPRTTDSDYEYVPPPFAEELMVS